MAKVILKFKSAYENKHPVYELFIDGKEIDLNDPKSLIEGKKEIELCDGEHYFEISQNNFFTKSTPVGDTIKMVSRLVDATPYKYEESPYYVKANFRAEICGDGNIEIELLENNNGGNFTAYSINIKAENIKIENFNQVCEASRSAAGKWFFHKGFIVLLGICITSIFAGGAYFAFQSKSVFMGIIFSILTLLMGIITVSALSNLIIRHQKDKAFRNKKVFIDSENREIKISKDGEL